MSDCKICLHLFDEGKKLEARIAKLRTGLCRLRNEAESYRVECDDGYAYLIDVAESVLTEDDKESAGSDE